MNRRSFPSGQSSASKIRALYLHLEKTKGAEAADAWLAKIRVEKADLDDETRLVPLTTVHAALVAAKAVAGESVVEDAAMELVAPENLGVWMRVLRGTRSPEEAFTRLDGSESEYGRTTRWETIEGAPGHWRGRVRIAHDPELEEDKLIARARAAELSVVPVLFGFSRADVERLASEEGTQEYDVRWHLPSTSRAAMVGGIVGIATTFVPFALNAGSAIVGLTGAAGAAVGAIAGTLIARDRARRSEALAQSFRVHALERSLQLKEEREGAQTGNLEGTIVAGQYRIGAGMGSGASGVIYEAMRIGDGTPVAIKLLRAAAAHDTVASDRLRREAEALGLSWHPNVVEVLDHGHLADGTSYLVMELLRGESLASRIKTKGKLTAEELWPIAAQLADAMVAVHAAGVVHRDLKPSNIFLLPDPESENGERTKILDFGIARVEWEEMRITNTGAPLGTSGYMSPEQESGGDIDARSDLYALGAVFYECLVGDLPPPVEGELFRRPSTHPSPSDSGTQRAAPQIPPVWRAVIEKALSRKPDDRHADARALLHEIRAIRGASEPPNSARVK